MAGPASVERLDYFMRAVFAELKRVGKRAKIKDVLLAIRSKLELTDHEKSHNDSGAPRWETNVRFHLTDCVRAGYLLKEDGTWTLTEKGEKALALPPGELIRTAQREYRQWHKTQKDKVSGGEESDDSDAPEAKQQASYDTAKETARTEIEQHIDRLTPYEFQDLVAELLKAMGYHVTRVAPKGPDGGSDITAYKDPLGTTAPRVTVQVKHHDQKVGAKDVRELEGLLRRDGDIGLFVSSGGFSSEAEREIRSSHKHIETMDLARIISLWQENYDKIGQPGKTLLPLVKVFFLAPEQE